MVFDPFSETNKPDEMNNPHLTQTAPLAPSSQSCGKVDISQRALRLGRIIDRMARGKYIILVDVGSHEWTANILSESTLNRIATIFDDGGRQEVQK